LFHLLFSNSPEKEARFRVHKQQHSTVWAFHGSAIENWCVVTRSRPRSFNHLAH
jgi:hypothetical protein